MTSIKFDTNWWKWGEATRQIVLEKYPKLKAHLQQRFKTQLDERISEIHQS
ncbi:hypothetical protein BH10BAC4_BH10BAC4_14980 [soil metagenome]